METYRLKTLLELSPEIEDWLESNTNEDLLLDNPMPGVKISIDDDSFTITCGEEIIAKQSHKNHGRWIQPYTDDKGESHPEEYLAENNMLESDNRKLLFSLAEVAWHRILKHALVALPAKSGKENI